MRLSPLMIAAFGTLTLAACTQGEPKDGEAAAGGETAAANEAGTPITLADFPSPKPGLWRVTTTTDGGATTVEVRCEGPAKPFEAPESMPGCVDTASRISGGVRFDRKCMTDGNESGIRITMKGDFQTRSDSLMEYRAVLPNKEVMAKTERTEAVYQGPCAAGQEPGVVE